MQYIKRFFIPSVGLLVLSLCATAQADVEHRQINPMTRITYVSDDDWQPENFDNGIAIPAVHILDASINLDGKDDEPQWKNATEVHVPLYYGEVGTVSLKAIYTDKEVFLRVRWPDATKDDNHHPWIWDTEKEHYIEGSQVEDSVLLSFEAGCEWTPSLLSGYIYDFDAWHWLAARSDPIGQALDLYGNVQDRKLGNANFGVHQSRVEDDQWQLKFTENRNVDMNAGWNELNRVYIKQPVTKTLHIKAVPDGGPRSPQYFQQLPPPVTPPRVEGQTYPQFSPVKLTDSAGEVSAKGHWEGGYWTVEFRRDLETPVEHIYDTIFNRLVQFSVHVFDHTDQLNEVSESGRLFLQFQPADLMLVKK